MSSSRIAVATIAALWATPFACAPPVAAPLPAAPLAPSSEVALAPVPAVSSQAPPASASSATNAPPPPPARHVRHRGAPPEVPASLVGLRDALADLGQIALDETDARRPAITCKGCLLEHPEQTLRFAVPPIAGSFTAAAKRELVLSGEGVCGRDDEETGGCELLVGDGPEGRAVLRVHVPPGRARAQRAHRIEDGRDLLVGVLDATRYGKRWTEASAVDFKEEQPFRERLVELFVADGCKDNAYLEVTSRGAIEKVSSIDLDHDGRLDIVVAGSQGEIVLKDTARECQKPRTPTQAPFTVRLLRRERFWEADKASDKLLTTRAGLRARGVKGLGPTGDE